MTSTASAETPLLSNFAERRRALEASGPDWVRELRAGGLQRFRHLGWPTTREEHWRTTNLAPISSTPFVPAETAAPTGLVDRLPAVARLDLGGPRLAFLDGRFQPELSSREPVPAGLWVGSLADAIESIPDRLRPLLTARATDHSQALDALNAAFLEDGAVVLAGRDAATAAPVQLLFVTTGDGRPSASHPRTLIAAERGARLSVVEMHVSASEGEYFTNSVAEVFAADGADVDHCRIQMESPRAFHVSNIHSRQTRDSVCTLHNLNLGGRLVRNDVVSVLDGEGADCRLFGLYLTRGEQHVDNHTVLDHAKPNGSSRELYKGILDGASRAVFNGRIVVRADAQKTDAKQSNQHLLLSEGALAKTRPQLEIYADDVKCTHGATIGRLDEEAIFYLRSRGIGDLEARNLMIASFAGEVLEALPRGPLRDELQREVEARLPRLTPRTV